MIVTYPRSLWWQLCDTLRDVKAAPTLQATSLSAAWEKEQWSGCGNGLTMGQPKKS
jgi:hypothetical protein